MNRDLGHYDLPIIRVERGSEASARLRRLRDIRVVYDSAKIQGIRAYFSQLLKSH